MFTRLSEELTRSRWSGLPPWEALHALAEELGLPELDDFADIMRLSGEEGASVYANLRARSAAMRTAMLNDEIAEANAVGERMTHPRLASRSHLHGPARRAIPAPDVQRHLNHRPQQREPTPGRNNHDPTTDSTYLILALSQAIETRARRQDERGSVTTEHVLWAVAVIAIVAIVVAAVKTYVTTQAGNIQ